MGNTISFGTWFRPIVEQSGLKHKTIAAEADIDPVSLSRILNNAQGVSKETASNLAKAINRILGREAANIELAVRLAVGLTPDTVVDPGFFKGIEKLSPERQAIARKQVRAIIDALAEEEETDDDFDYVDDDAPDNEPRVR